MNKPVTKVDGLLFDKDGTLFDFHATWSSWGAALIDELSEGCVDTQERLAATMHFDLASEKFLPTSPVIANTNREVAECVGSALPGRDVDALEELLMIRAAETSLSPAVPLAPFLNALSGQGIVLGVMTNDSEFGARAHLRSAEVENNFDFIAGFDSGHGAKPEPDPLLAFARVMGLEPARVAMVGDSNHDLLAGRRAGMQTIGVLTGTATRSDLFPLADAVLPDIGHILEWLKC